MALVVGHEKQKELSKWDQPYRFRKFPQMVYRAQYNPVTKRHEVLVQRDPLAKDDAILEQFNNSCQLIVEGEEQLRKALDDGWRETPKEAMALHEGLQQDIARAAAERAHSDRNMSEKARSEAAAADAATEEQVPEVPEAGRRARRAS